MTARAHWFWFVAAAAVAVAADQGSKAWARGALAVGHDREVIGGFWSWHLSFNTGIAFSLFDISGVAGRALLVAMAVAACTAVAILQRRSGSPLRSAAFGLIAGGALGNGIDRVTRGPVTDFVLWHAGRHYWPIFNVADAALLIGVALLVIVPARSPGNQSA